MPIFNTKITSFPNIEFYDILVIIGSRGRQETLLLILTFANTILLNLKARHKISHLTSLF